MRYEEKNTVGRAKLRRLTTERKMTIVDIARETGYRRQWVSRVIAGKEPIGKGLSLAIENFTDGEIKQSDWLTSTDEDVDAIPIYVEYRGGRPASATKKTMKKTKDRGQPHAPGGTSSVPTNQDTDTLLAAIRGTREEIKKGKKKDCDRPVPPNKPSTRRCRHSREPS